MAFVARSVAATVTAPQYPDGARRATARSVGGLGRWNPVSHPVVQATWGRPVQQLSGGAVDQSDDSQFGQTLVAEGVALVANCEHHRDGLGEQSPSHEREDLCRHLVEPLRVVDEAARTAVTARRRPAPSRTPRRPLPRRGIPSCSSPGSPSARSCRPPPRLGGPGLDFDAIGRLTRGDRASRTRGVGQPGPDRDRSATARHRPRSVMPSTLPCVTRETLTGDASVRQGPAQPDADAFVAFVRQVSRRVRSAPLGCVPRRARLIPSV